MTFMASRVARSIAHQTDRFASAAIDQRQLLSAGAALGALLSLPFSLRQVSAQGDVPQSMAKATDLLLALGLPDVTVTVGEYGVTVPVGGLEGQVPRQRDH